MKSSLVYTHQLFALGLILAALATGCGEPKPAASPDIKTEAYRLIDKQRTDEAIELLENALTDEPENYGYAMTLASAYAHKGGMRFQRWLEMADAAESMSSAASKADKSRPKSSEKGKGEAAAPVDEAKDNPKYTDEIDQALAALVEVLKNFSVYSEAYASLPAITKLEAIYLKHAIGIIDDIQGPLQPEDALYRALLNTLLFKHLMAEELVSGFDDRRLYGGEECRLDLGHINDTVSQLGHILIQILSDLTYANPKASSGFEKMSVDIADGVDDLTTAASSLHMVEVGIDTSVQQVALFYGFGKILKCEGGGDK